MFMKYLNNYILKKLNESQVDIITKEYKKANTYWKQYNIYIEPQIIPYSENKNYYRYKVDK